MEAHGQLIADESEQQSAARRRIEERAAARKAHVAAIEEPGGLGRADTLVNVARRVDRLSRAVVGEPVPQTPAEAPDASDPETLITAAVERAAPKLGVTSEVEAAATPEDAAGVVLEAIIGEPNFLEVRYLQAGARAARAVGRVIVRDEDGREAAFGTGSMVSPRLLLTNHHVLEDADVARRSAIEFDFEDGLDDRPRRPVELGLDPDAFFLADKALDFALVAVAASDKELGPFGFNPLLAVQGKATNGDFVSIVQHPGGREKQVALRENRIVDEVDSFLHYATDTEPGSSGSPVFNDAWEVVALHHAAVRVPPTEELGEVVNEGVRISRIVEFARRQDIPAEQHALLAGLVLSKRVVVSGPEAQPDADGTVELPAPAPAVAPVTPASLTVQIPLEVTISVGTPTSAPTVSAVVADDAAALDGDATDEAVTIDPDYDDRRGYDASFLGSGPRRVPLPTLPPELLTKAAKMKGVSGSSAHILRYHHYSVVLNRERKLAFFTAVNIDGRQIVRIKRETDKWFRDPRIDPSEQAGEEIYTDNPLDRGHLVRRLDPAWAPTMAQAKVFNDDTFHFTNCTPQHKKFNENKGTWAGLEDYLLDNADNSQFKATVFTGPVLAPDDHPYRGILLPRQFWKVAVIVLKGGKLSATGYLLSQEKLIQGLETLETLEDFSFGAYKTFQVPIAQIEDLTDLTFGSLKAVDPLDGLEALELREIGRREDLTLS